MQLSPIKACHVSVREIFPGHAAMDPVGCLTKKHSQNDKQKVILTIFPDHRNPFFLGYIPITLQIDVFRSRM